MIYTTLCVLGGRKTKFEKESPALEGHHVDVQGVITCQVQAVGHGPK